MTNIETAEEIRQKWLKRAGKMWSRSIALRNPEATGHNKTTLRAAMNRATLPVARWQLAYQTLPPPAVVQESYGQLIGVGKEALETFRAASQRDNSRITGNSGEYRRGLVGAIDELNVLLLLQRYGIHNLTGPNDAQTWLATPSFLSQDCGRNGEGPNQNWDVSVLTQLSDEPADYAYRIQVKHSPKCPVAKKYSDEISMVYVLPDLVVTKDSNISANILEECIGDYELNGDPSLGSIVDQRTEQLLDVLG